MDYRQSIAQSAPMTLPHSPNIAFSEAERESVRPLMTEDFAIPAKWIILAGGLVGWLAVAASLVFCRAVKAPPDLLLILFIGLLAGSIGAISAYLFVAPALWGADLPALRTRERIKGIPPQVTESAPPIIEKADWWVRAPDGARFLMAGNLDIPRVLAVEWCQAAAEGRSLAVRLWGPRFALPDGSGGELRYQQFLDALAAGPNPRVKNHGGSRGYRPTVQGWIGIAAMLADKVVDPPALPAPDTENEDES